jgi:hypothetical protein
MEIETESSVFVQQVPQQQSAEFSGSAANPADDEEEADDLNMSEADALRRKSKREQGLAAVRKSPEYLFLLDLWNKGVIRDGHLVAPPAAKHSAHVLKGVSKRKWEAGMMDWRHEVKQEALKHGYQPPPPSAQ